MESLEILQYYIFCKFVIYNVIDIYARKNVKVPRNSLRVRVRSAPGQKYFCIVTGSRLALCSDMCSLFSAGLRGTGSFQECVTAPLLQIVPVR